METVTYSIKLFSNVGKFKILWTCGNRKVREKIKAKINKKYPGFKQEGSYVQIIQFKNKEPEKIKTEIEQMIIETIKENNFKTNKKNLDKRNKIWKQKIFHLLEKAKRNSEVKETKFKDGEQISLKNEKEILIITFGKRGGLFRALKITDKIESTTNKRRVEKWLKSF